MDWSVDIIKKLYQKMINREVILDHSCVPTCQVSYEYKMMWVLQLGLYTNIQS